MSVIAKMLVRGQTNFGVGQLFELGCVCENDLMAAYAGSEEDRLFTKYSPSGEMKVHQPASFCLSSQYEPEEPDNLSAPAPKAYYVMALAEAEHEYVDDPRCNSWDDKNFPGSAAWCFAQCHSLTQFGGDTARVEFRAGNGRGRGVDALNWKMSVDNPAASNQFKPGQNYWIALYDASRFDRDAAIRAAHGHG